MNSGPIDSAYQLPPSPDKLQKYIVGLQSVLEVTRDLAAEKDLDSLLKLIIDRACTALECERASVFLYDDEKQELFTRKVTELGEGASEIRVSIQEGIAGLVARERRIEQVDDPYSHPEFNAQFDQLLQFRTRNILSAPLLSWGQEEKLLGVLQLLNKQNGSFEPTDKQLLKAFAAHAAIAIDRAILARHYKEMVEILVSLDLAKQIQRGLLPETLPEISGYEIAAKSQPADQTGGDYYDTLPGPEQGVVVADVSGHGFGPSLLMATLRATLRGIASRDAAPDVVLNELARMTLDDLQRVQRFVTLLYGTLDSDEHCFRYANAGHGPVALHYEASTGKFHSLVDDDARGFPLGWFEQSFEACTPIQLSPGDLLLLGTDGIVETRRGGEMFGTARLCEITANLRQQPLDQIIDAIFQATIDFNEDLLPDDDLTLMIIRRQ